MNFSVKIFRYGTENGTGITFAWFLTLWISIRNTNATPAAD